MKRTPLRKGTSKLNRGSKGLKRSSSISKGSKRMKSRPKTKEEILEKRELKEQMWNMFLRLWEKRGPFSELSGEFIPGPPLSIYFHHCAPKSIEKWATLLEENIIILTFSQHQTCENDPNFYPEVVRRRKLVESMKPNI